MADIRILDCTLRDGGYYNRWDFEPDLVNGYLQAMAQVPVDVVELGLRTFCSGEFNGPNAFTTDDYISTLAVPDNLAIGVMINAKDVIEHRSGIAAAVDALFAPTEASRVNLVRIAAHVRELERIAPAVHRLIELGYRVAVNIMQVNQYESEKLTEAAGIAAKWPIECLYFADSLGNMTRPDVERVVAAFRGAWSGAIGCHMHDNMGRAVDNTLAAVQAGATNVDATVLGMGRGAGNAKLETLLLEIQRVFGHRYNMYELLGIIQEDFQPMWLKYGWGPNAFYFMSAVHGIHPTYVQELLSGGRYQAPDIIAALEFLSTTASTSYRAEALQNAVEFGGSQQPGTWSARNWARGRSVVILGTGSSARTHARALKRFVERHQPLVIALNLDSGLPGVPIDATTAAHPVRMIMDAARYRQADGLIAPMAAFPPPVRTALADTKVRDYGMAVENGSFSFGETGCVVPRPLTIAYALAVATAGGAERIFLVGLDGYGPGDPRQQEMTELLECYQQSPGAVPLVALTATTYPVRQSSVYAPNLQ